MNRAASVLFWLYTTLPYVFFTALGLAVLTSGNFIISDQLLDITPLKILALGCAMGIFMFPAILLAILLSNRRKWPKLIYPFISYSIYLASVFLAGNIGWWTD